VLGPGKPTSNPNETRRYRLDILWTARGGKHAALLLARRTSSELVCLSARSDGIKEIRTYGAATHTLDPATPVRLFSSDEVHRFNKSQHDAFPSVPHVEAGNMTLIGVEQPKNPSFEVNRAATCPGRVLSVLAGAIAEKLKALRGARSPLGSGGLGKRKFSSR